MALHPGEVVPAMAWHLEDLQFKNDARPPGAKRLRVALSAVAYVLLGLPVWWHATSLHRPALPHEEMRAAAAAAAADRSPLLLVSLDVMLVAAPGLQLPPQLAAASMLRTLEQAVSQGRQLQGAAVQLSTTINAGGVCDHAAARELQSCGGSSGGSSSGGSSSSTCSAAGLPCASIAQPPVSSSSSSKQQQLQLDDWLLQQQEQAGWPAAAGPAPAGRYVLYLLPAPAAAARPGPELIVGRHRHAWLSYQPELVQQQPQQLLQAASSAVTQLLACCFGLHSSRVALAAAARLPVSAAGHTQLSFSLLNAAPAPGWHYSWDFAAFERQFLLPVAASLAPVARVSIESQVLHFTPAREPGRWSSKRDAFVVRQDQLPFFIDSEWSVEAGRAVMQHELALPVNSSCSWVPSQAAQSQQEQAAAAGGVAAEQAALLESHVLHFLVYIPPRDQHPLLLLGPGGRRRDSNSFWIPAWGGLQVLNQPAAGNSSQPAAAADEGGGSSSSSSSSTTSWEATQLQPDQYHLIAQVVVAQLQALFGVAADASASPAVARLPAGRAGFCAWQIDALVRRRTAGDLAEAARVLGSLSKLVLELPNLEMPDVIGQQVQQALSNIALARRHVAAADYHAAGAAAGAARAAAEAAFLHPAVLAQLNFPESHKLGVYMPLFLPMAVPLLQGLVAELRHWAVRRRHAQPH